MKGGSEAGELTSGSPTADAPVGAAVADGAALRALTPDSR